MGGQNRFLLHCATFNIHQYAVETFCSSAKKNAPRMRGVLHGTLWRLAVA